jgi:CRISPR system Cascade subunit CasE
VREVDEGYVAHIVMRELWKQGAPAPFAVHGRGRALEVWGYSRIDAAALVDHAAAFRDPSLVGVLGDLQAIVSKPMPSFERGRRVGFVVRACPVVRLAGPKSGHRAGAEVDAFLAQCFAAGPQALVSREDVYRNWLEKTLSRPQVTGVRVLRANVAAMSRGRFVRRTHQQLREVRRLERPDVRFEGEMVVEDGDRLLGYLGHGVGRHRSFGFGALMLTPAGTGAALTQDMC